MISFSVLLLGNSALAQLVPNATNPMQLQLRSHELYDDTYQYWEWKADYPHIYLNAWIFAEGNTYQDTTPLKIICSYSNTLVFDGKIEAEEIEVKNINLPDYVFDSGYSLRTIEELEYFIMENGHLPEVPSAAEVAKNGMNLTTMTNAMLKKIEELTLYVIEVKKENEMLKSRVDAMVGNQ